MVAFAAELEAEADALEQASQAPPTPRVTQIQMQVQQQGGSPGEEPDDDPASKA